MHRSDSGLEYIYIYCYLFSSEVPLLTTLLGKRKKSVERGSPGKAVDQLCTPNCEASRGGGTAPAWRQPSPFDPVVPGRDLPGDAAQFCGQRRPHQQQVSMALGVGKVNRLLGFGRAALSARLRPRERADQAKEEMAFQFCKHARNNSLQSDVMVAISRLSKQAERQLWPLKNLSDNNRITTEKQFMTMIVQKPL